MSVASFPAARSHPIVPSSSWCAIGGRVQVCTYTEGGRLEGSAQQPLLVVEIRPLALTAGVAKLARGQKTSRLSFTHVCCTVLSVLWSLVFRSGGGAEWCEISDCGVRETACVVRSRPREIVGFQSVLVLVVWGDLPVLRCVDGSS